MVFHRKQPRTSRDHFPHPRGFKAAIDNEKKPGSPGQHNNNLRCQRPKPDQRVIASKSRSIRYEAVDPECHEAQTSFDKYVTRSTDPLSSLLNQILHTPKIIITNTPRNAAGSLGGGKHTKASWSELDPNFQGA